MAIEVLSGLPAEFYAGDTVSFTHSNGDYPPGDGWTLHYSLQGQGGRYSVKGTTSGDNYALSLSADASKKIVPGVYRWTAYVTNDSNERVTVDYGYVTVLPDPSAPLTKSPARLTLEAMEDALKRLAAGTDAQFSANGQSFSKKNIGELQKAIAIQRDLVRSEERTSMPELAHRSRGIAIRFGRTTDVCDDD